ncbi:hypothetical protein LguiA_025306 [Lonicera macranthoides]
MAGEWAWPIYLNKIEFSPIYAAASCVAISDLEMAEFEKVLNCKVVALEIIFNLGSIIVLFGIPSKKICL